MKLSALIDKLNALMFTHGGNIEVTYYDPDRDALIAIGNATDVFLQRAYDENKHQDVVCLKTEKHTHPVVLLV